MIGRAGIALAACLFLSVAARAEEPVFIDWRVGEVTSVYLHSDSGASITIESARVSLTVSAYASDGCHGLVGTILRFRVRRGTWWSGADPVVQFYPANDTPPCFGLAKKWKVKVSGQKKKKEILIYEAVVSSLSEYDDRFGYAQERQAAREVWWKENAVGRGVPGDPANDRASDPEPE